MHFKRRKSRNHKRLANDDRHPTKSAYLFLVDDCVQTFQVGERVVNLHDDTGESTSHCTRKVGNVLHVRPSEGGS